MSCSLPTAQRVDAGSPPPALPRSLPENRSKAAGIPMSTSKAIPRATGLDLERGAAVFFFLVFF